MALQAIREELARSGVALCVCATGYGKGHLIRLISESLKEGSTLLVIVPRVNLVRDLAQRTGGEVYCATLGKKDMGQITVATKQSLKDINSDIVVLDEAHSYSEEFLMECKSNCKYLIVFTATAWTSDGYIWD